MLRIDDRIQDYSPEEIARWMDELPQWRRAQALAYKHDAGRRQSLLAYRLLCQMLREEYGIVEPPTFVYGEHGKPNLIIENVKLKIKNEAAPHFSLSHCRTAVACIIDSRPCGIDIEPIDRKVSDSLIRHTMNEGEQTEIAHSIDRNRAFLRLWTQKEAVGKLLGTGIAPDSMKDLLHPDRYLLDTRETERHIVSTAHMKS